MKVRKLSLPFAVFQFVFKGGTLMGHGLPKDVKITNVWVDQGHKTMEMLLESEEFRYVKTNVGELIPQQEFKIVEEEKTIIQFI